MVPSRAKPISNGKRVKTLLIEWTKVFREGNFIAIVYLKIQFKEIFTWLIFS